MGPFKAMIVRVVFFSCVHTFHTCSIRAEETFKFDLGRMFKTSQKGRIGRSKEGLLVM